MAEAKHTATPEDVAAGVVEQFEIWLKPYVRAEPDAEVAQDELHRMIAEAVKSDRTRLAEENARLRAALAAITRHVGAVGCFNLSEDSGFMVDARAALSATPATGGENG